MEDMVAKNVMSVINKVVYSWLQPPG